jgi:small subunit ribosomal protein S6
MFDDILYTSLKVFWRKPRGEKMARIRHYETMFIIKPTLSDEEITNQIDTVKSNIEKNGGEIVSVDDMGVKSLAYEIQRNKRGYYYVIYFKAPSESIIELERTYRINENILRFIFIKYENKKEISAWTNMCNEANKKNSK